MTATQDYMAAVRSRTARGMARYLAEMDVRRHEPKLFNAMIAEADVHRLGRKPAPTPAQSAATTLTLESMLRRAINGERFDDVAIYAACKSRHRTVNWFHQEVVRERSHKAQQKFGHNEASNQADNDPRFDTMVAEAAKCERDFSDSEIMAAGHDVVKFKAALSDAVHAKITQRTYRVGNVSCDCSSGVCRCEVA